MVEDPKYVLVVDDDQAILNTIIDVLGMEGIGAHATTESLEVETLLRKLPVRVVVSDINMPGLDGLELLDRIKAVEAELERRIRVIILTGVGAEDKASVAVERGAWRYMPKPFDIDAFIDTIKEALASEQE